MLLNIVNDYRDMSDEELFAEEERLRAKIGRAENRVKLLSVMNYMLAIKEEQIRRLKK